MKTREPKSGFRRTIPLRRRLRHNLTNAEKLFWTKIANRQFFNLKFRKQHGIGDYIIDFYCPEKHLIIEIDGDSHAVKLNKINDQQRTKYFKSLGYKIIRYQNHDNLNNIEDVFQDLISKLNKL